MSIPVQFVYFTGIKGDIFNNARLKGSWDENGLYSEKWGSVPMKKAIGEDGCACFSTTIKFSDSEVSRQFHWGVEIDGPGGEKLWAILTEVNDHAKSDRCRTFVLKDKREENSQEEYYYLTHCRRLGANKYYTSSKSKKPGIRFAVWAPNAEKVEVVFGNRESGYIADDGTGIDPNSPSLPMVRRQDGVWETDAKISHKLIDCVPFDHRPYMFRITKKGGLYCLPDGFVFSLSNW